MPASTSSLRARVLDKIGVSVSLLCLVHCLVLPFALVGLSAWGTAGLWNTLVHTSIAVLAIPAAVLTALPGYREHRRVQVPVLLLGGALVLGLSLLLHDVIGENGHVAATVVGSLLLLTGHVQNYRLRARCKAHTLPHHEAHHG